MIDCIATEAGNAPAVIKPNTGYRVDPTTGSLVEEPPMS